MARFKLLTLKVFLVLCAAGLAEARFQDRDAELVDQEERANTETWNDKNSYRYPRSWDRAWDSVDVGYRVNAGSLNASRFNYEDDLRVAPNPLDPVTVSFTQVSREDLVELERERELRIGWSFARGTRVSILGDAGTFKEFGDIGVALALWESERHRTEIYYWSVDHYYQSKKSDDNGVVSKPTRTMGGKSSGESEIGAWRVKYEVDTPLDWTHPDAGYRYQYARRLGEARVQIPVKDGISVYGSGLGEWKYEKKTSLTATGDRPVFKEMRRSTHILEMGMERVTDSRDTIVGAVQGIRRDVDYANGERVELTPAWRESYAPEVVRRSELGGLFSWHRPVGESVALQQGLYVNRVRVTEDARVWETDEWKYQLLFDFSLSGRSKFAVNTTWDMDQVVRDFPYSRKSPFRPWGGGDLQFLMAL